MFEHYDEPVFTNDLLTLARILDNNVADIVFTPQIDPEAIPRGADSTRHTDALSSFQSFLDFYESLHEEGPHAEVITYYKLKHAKLSFIAQHSKYMQLKNAQTPGPSGYYNEEMYDTLLACNEYISNRSSSDMFLAPLYMSRFFKKNGEMQRCRALRREARRIAKIANKLDVVREIE